MAKHLVGCHNLQAVNIAVKLLAQGKGTLIRKIKEAGLIQLRKQAINGCVKLLSITNFLLHDLLPESSFSLSSLFTFSRYYTAQSLLFILDSNILYIYAYIVSVFSFLFFHFFLFMEALLFIIYLANTMTIAFQLAVL
ncbi:hypothetical protein Tcan_01073, partial [Toxocara canis]